VTALPAGIVRVATEAIPDTAAHPAHTEPTATDPTASLVNRGSAGVSVANPASAVKALSLASETV
jgi:hypothetical protein